MTHRFAANLSMMFTEHPFEDRFAAAARAGFEAVEFLFPYAHPPEALAERLAAHGLSQVLFNMPPGDWEAGERGLACLPGREAELAEGVRTALRYADTLGCPRLHLMSGIAPAGADVARLDAVWRANVAAAARACAEAGVDLLVEPINPFDMPGYFLGDFGRALELIEGLRTEGAPVRLQFDIYHCARIHGDAAAWIERAAPVIGHFQIAGVPHRHEPDPADPATAAALAAAARWAPGCAIGCEYRPAGRTEDGLGWLARARAAS